MEICDKWKQMPSSFMVISHITNFTKVGVSKLHFSDSDYESGKMQRGVTRRNRLKADAVPSVFLVALNYIHAEKDNEEGDPHGRSKVLARTR